MQVPAPMTLSSASAAHVALFGCAGRWPGAPRVAMLASLAAAGGDAHSGGHDEEFKGSDSKFATPTVGVDLLLDDDDVRMMPLMEP